ncbi:MAG TPA: YdcF family protein [Bryobacteraceae bacterium]|nr:YdcF family protein [Bryobacteraceae bacterium]
MKRILRATALILAVAVVLLLLFHAAILAALGNYLVKAGPPQKADIIVVLAGDGFGHRILTAGDLIKQGYASKALVSGPNGNYGNYECDLAIPFAVKAGDPESEFLHLEHRGRSTAEEAQVVVKKLREMGVKRVILVTSNYHTRRAGSIFRRAAPDLEFYVVASPDEFFNPDSWWKNREASKTFIFEWMKTVAEW